MQVKSMAQKPEEKREEQAEVAAEAQRPRYPYGLCVRLDEEAIEKLGWSDLPKVGAKCKLEAKAVVISVQNMEGLQHSMMSVELQITDLGVEVGGGKASVDALYPGGGKTSLKGE